MKLAFLDPLEQRLLELANGTCRLKGLFFRTPSTDSSPWG